ncbi:hypothetical protein KPATCC21470_7524 [Kitasatospora purpeofusca]
MTALPVTRPGGSHPAVPVPVPVRVHGSVPGGSGAGTRGSTRA